MFDPLTVSAITLKTSLLVVAVGLIALLMARHSAAWRHLLWTSALALSLLIPLAVMYLPSYVQVPLPWEAAEPWARDEPARVATAARPADAEPDALSHRGNNLANCGTPEAYGMADRNDRLAHRRLGRVTAQCLAHVGLMRWVHKARPDLSQAWAATLSRVTSDAALRRSLRVLESDHATSPCTWGLIRPVMLLPAAGGDWPESQRRFALLHELAHIRRWDYLTTQISSMACALHWYNPFVWFAAVQASKLQEQACDDVVLMRAGGRQTMHSFW